MAGMKVMNVALSGVLNVVPPPLSPYQGPFYWAQGILRQNGLKAHALKLCRAVFLKRYPTAQVAKVQH